MFEKLGGKPNLPIQLASLAGTFRYCAEAVIQVQYAADFRLKITRSLLVVQNLKRTDNKPDRLVIVVHGVGDPQPGKTINIFARSLANDDQPLQEQQDVAWLVDKPDGSQQVKAFPVHQRRLQSQTQTVELAEAFWGDLSRVSRGWVGVIHGVLQIIFGLRYVSYVAADQPGKPALWLKRLGLLTSQILHGPVLAVTTYLALLMLAICGTQMLWPDSYKIGCWPSIVLAAVSLSTLTAAAIGIRLTNSRVAWRFWHWLNVTTWFVTGLMALKFFWLDEMFPELGHECPEHPGLLMYCRVLLILLELLWFAEIQVLLAMAGCWLAALGHKRAYRPALHVAFLVPALAVGIWGQAIPMLWVGAKEGLGVLAELPEFAVVFDEALPFLGVQLMMMAVITTAAILVFLRYSLWRRTATVAGFNNGNRPPRLIVNRSLQLVVAICTGIGVALVSALCVIQLLGYSHHDFQFGELMVEANKYAISVLVPASGLALLLFPKLRPALDMLLDVVNQFYFRPTQMNDALDDDDEFDIVETTFENGALFFSRRDAIHQRIKRILTHYRDQLAHDLKGRPDLVIVSHSQGTMAAIEVLNDEELGWLNNSFSSVSLVTMGSPLSHIYQHYFGHIYPALDKPYWVSLRRRIDRWTNICRIDDFVGTDILFAKAQAASRIGNVEANEATFHPTGSSLSQASNAERSSSGTPNQFSNHPVGPRGHTNYWADLEVLTILRPILLGNSTDTSARSSSREAA